MLTTVVAQATAVPASGDPADAGKLLERLASPNFEGALAAQISGLDGLGEVSGGEVSLQVVPIPAAVAVWRRTTTTTTCTTASETTATSPRATFADTTTTAPPTAFPQAALPAEPWPNATGATPIEGTSPSHGTATTTTSVNSTALLALDDGAPGAAAAAWALVPLALLALCCGAPSLARCLRRTAEQPKPTVARFAEPRGGWRRPEAWYNPVVALDAFPDVQVKAKAEAPWPAPGEPDSRQTLPAVPPSSGLRSVVASFHEGASVDLLDLHSPPLSYYAGEPLLRPWPSTGHATPHRAAPARGLFLPPAPAVAVELGGQAGALRSGLRAEPLATAAPLVASAFAPPASAAALADPSAVVARMQALEMGAGRAAEPLRARPAPLAPPPLAAPAAHGAGPALAGPGQHSTAEVVARMLSMWPLAFSRTPVRCGSTTGEATLLSIAPGASGGLRQAEMPTSGARQLR
ncbi:unnamed protein product [Prorocentrum cordatum]|uniref:Uncharacterized protein n=1 Tax=Prorocentrum cordatum TaxID=2364126 RepID=A0ABN9Y6S8_9DINO|nr:unnamed protein product [Polarella glacialis]